MAEVAYSHADEAHPYQPVDVLRVQSSDEIELTPEYEARYDYFVDVKHMDAHDAWAHILNEMQEAARMQEHVKAAQRIADSTRHQEVATAALKKSASSVEHEATETKVQSTKPNRHRHYSRRGGRSYAELSDSETDPHWNGTAPEEPRQLTAEDAQAFETFAVEVHEAAAQSLAKHHDIPVEAARAMLKAKHEVNKRGY